MKRQIPYLDGRFGWRSRVKKHAEDRASMMSEWTDRDMLIGGHLYPAGTITIADVLDHAAHAALLTKIGDPTDNDGGRP
jgi:hypothetical protein